MDPITLNVLMGLPPMGGPPTTGPRGPQLDMGGGAAPAAAPTAPASGGNGDFMDALFPSGGFENVVGPEAIKRARQASLLRAGLALMAAGGPRPMGTRNFGEDLMRAFDPATMNANVDREVQAQQMSFQMMGRQALMKALQDDPQPAESATATDRANWAGRMAARLAQAGPFAMPYAQQYAELGKTIRESAPSYTHVEGVTRNGQYGDVLVNPENGEEQFLPRQDLSPDQQAQRLQGLLTDFRQSIAPYEDAARAYRSWQSIPRGAVGKAADEQRVMAANDILNPGQHTSNPSLITDISLKGILEHLGLPTGLTAEDRSNLSAMVENAIIQRRREAAHHVLPQFKALANAYKLDDSFLYDPFENLDVPNVPTPAPASAPGVRARADAVRKAAGVH